MTSAECQKASARQHRLKGKLWSASRPEGVVDLSSYYRQVFQSLQARPPTHILLGLRDQARLGVGLRLWGSNKTKEGRQLNRLMKLVPVIRISWLPRPTTDVRGRPPRKFFVSRKVRGMLEHRSWNVMRTFP